MKKESKKFTSREKPSVDPKTYRRWQRPRKNASHRAQAMNFLACARHTARLKEFPNPEYVVAFDEYESIDDDIEDMKFHLQKAKLALADIGTDEKELEALREAEERLNASARGQNIPDAVRTPKSDDDDVNGFDDM